MDFTEHQDDKEAVTEQNDQPSFEEVSKNYNYKILHDIRKLGCSKKPLIAAAYRTFLDLCETRKFHEVTYYFHPELDVIYLKVQKKREDTEFEVVIPVLSSKKLSFKQIEDLQDAFKSTSITLGICDMNALIMYYKITKD